MSSADDGVIAMKPATGLALLGRRITTRTTMPWALVIMMLLAKYLILI